MYLTPLHRYVTFLWKNLHIPVYSMCRFYVSARLLWSVVCAYLTIFWPKYRHHMSMLMYVMISPISLKFCKFWEKMCGYPTIEFGSALETRQTYTIKHRVTNILISYTLSANECLWATKAPRVTRVGTYGEGNSPLKGYIGLLLILNSIHNSATDRRWARLRAKTPPARKPALLTTLSSSQRWAWSTLKCNWLHYPLHVENCILITLLITWKKM